MPVTVMRAVGASVLSVGLVAWAAVVGQMPVLQRGEQAALAAPDHSPQEHELTLAGHDLRLAAIVVVLCGVAVLVASVPRLAARPLPVLVAAGVTMFAANLGLGLLGLEGPVAVISFTVGALLALAAVALLALRLAGPSAPSSEPGTGRGSRRFLLAPALIAATIEPLLFFDPASFPAQRAFVSDQYALLVAAIRSLLVVAAVVCALAVGPHGHRRRPLAGALVALVLGILAATLPPSIVAGFVWPPLLSGALVAAVLLLAWAADPAGGPPTRRRAVGAALALVAVSLLTFPMVIVGLPLGMAVLALSGGRIGVDGLPVLGGGFLLGVALLLIDSA